MTQQPTEKPDQPEQPSKPAPSAERKRGEGRGAKISRHGHRTFLYIWSITIIAALVILIALVVSNTDKVKVSWVFGDGTVSLIWVIVGSAIAGWFAGVATSILYRFRTRAPRR